MTPRLRLLDRTIVGLTGLLLVVTAMGVLSWHYQHGPVARTVSLPPWLHHCPETAWWPWELGAVSLTSIGLAVCWLIAHLPRRTRGVIRLPGTDATGQLRLDLQTVADAAAGVLASTGAVNSAQAVVRREFGSHIVEIDVTTTAFDFPAASRAASNVHDQLDSVLNAAPTAIRTLVHLKRPRHRRRVH